MKKPLPVISEHKTLDWSIGFLIALSALLHASIAGFTAYQYNEIDMLPFWERKINPQFLPNDFFTNASESPNSRQVWGYLVLGLAKLTGTGWYPTLYVLKLIFISIIGPLFYLGLSKLYRQFIGQHISSFKLLSGLFCILCVSNNYFVQLFTIAWWPPFLPDANAHNFSLLLGLLALLWCGKIPGLVLSFASSMLHPVLGIFFFFLNGMILFSERNFRSLLLQGAVSMLLPFALHSVLFGSGTSLSATEFTRIYAWYSHPGHYIPSLFGKMGLTSLQVYALLSVLLIGVIGYAWNSRNRILGGISLGMLLFMNGLITLQYFLVEKYPVKLIALLGPSRYLMFMGWGIAFLYGSIFSEMFHGIKFPLKQGREFLEKKNVPRIAAAAMLLAFLVMFLRLDNPIEEKDSPALTWIRTQTPEGSTFVSNNWILDEMDIRYLGRRAVFAGDCFPFHENHFTEYYQRARAVYGTPEQWLGEPNIVLKRLYFFRKMNPEDFVAASERFPLDYVVIDARDSVRFEDFVPEYADSRLRIYALSAFKGYGIKHQPFVTYTDCVNP